MDLLYAGVAGSASGVFILADGAEPSQNARTAMAAAGV